LTLGAAMCCSSLHEKRAEQLCDQAKQGC